MAVQKELHKTHAAFDEPPREEATGAVGTRAILIQSVHALNRQRLLGEIQEANPAMFIQMMTEMSGERRGGTNGNGSSIDAGRDYNPLAGDDAGPGYDAE